MSSAPICPVCKAPLPAARPDESVRCGNCQRVPLASLPQTLRAAAPPAPRSGFWPWLLVTVAAGVLGMCLLGSLSLLGHVWDHGKDVDGAAPHDEGTVPTGMTERQAIVVVGTLPGERFAHADELKRSDGLDAKDHGKYCRVYTASLDKGWQYVIDLTSDDFDTYLRLEDAHRQPVRKSKHSWYEDDDHGGNRNARLIFQPPHTADYRIIATSSLRRATGRYTLTIRRELPGKKVKG